MTEIQCDENRNPSAAPQPEQPEKRSSYLDLAFPPVWLLASMVLVVVFASVLIGWKVVNLDHERSQITSSRQLLERDKAAHAKLLNDLPALEARHQSLSRDAEKLEGEVRASKAALENMSSDRIAAEKLAAKAKAVRAEADAAVDAARNELSELHSGIQKSRPLIGSLSQEMATLKKSESDIRAELGQLQEKKAVLQAEVAALEETRQQKLKIVEQLSKDNGEIQSLTKRFDAIAKDLEVNQKAASQTIQTLSKQVQSVTATSTEFLDQTKSLGGHVKALGSEKEGLASVLKDIQASAKGAEKGVEELKALKTKMEASASLFLTTAGKAEKHIESISGAAQGPIKTLEGGVAKLNSRIDDFGKVLTGLTEHAQSLEGKIGKVETAATTLSTAVGSVQTAAGNVDRESQRLGKAIEGPMKDLESGVGGLSRETITLKKAVLDFGTQLSGTETKLNELKELGSGFAALKSELTTSLGNLRKEIDSINRTLDEDAKNLKDGLQRLNAAVGSVTGASSVIQETSRTFGNTVGNASSTTDQLIQTTDQIKKTATALDQYQADIDQKISRLSQALEEIQKGLAIISEKPQERAKQPNAAN